MSAQSAKKKRIGSRRRVANQNEISKADEFHVGDSTSVAGSHIPEEHTESLNVLGHFDNSQSESQHPPSPEFSGGRRKLGSSRRLKGRHVKDSVTESYHEAREEVEDKTREKETTVSKQTPLAIQPERQEALSQGSEHDDMSATPEYSSEIQKTTTTNYPEADLESLIPKGRNLPTDLDENENDSEVVSDSCKLAETTQEGNDISILHSEKVKESAHLVGISELTSLSALSCPTVDQQLIDQSNFKEMPEEKLPSVCSVTEKEGKERDDDTESFRHDGNLQGSYLVSESHVESVVMQFSTTPEITTEKISPTENTKAECSVGQATILSPKEELPTDEEQNEHFNLSEVRGAHHSEDDVNKQHEQEIRLTEKHMPHDDTENSEIISGNLTEQTEVSDTYQSELTEKSTDGSPTNQDISYPEDKRDEHLTDENNFEALEQKNEDYHVYDTTEPQISDIERVDSALGQVYEIEGRVEDDIKPSAEQTAHQEKEGLFSEVEESESSLQTVQSEINATLDSQPQQDDTSFNPIGNRRKLGSSRRNRGRRHVKDSAAESDHEHKEDAESTSGNEAIETAQMLLATERTSQEELSQGSEHDVIPETHDSSLYSATVIDYSSEVQSPTTTNYPEADLESLIRESENLQKDHDERETHFKVEVSDKSVGATLEGAVKSDSLQSQEVKGQHPSEDAVNKEHEQEVKPTENQEMPQIDNSSESVIRDATENSEIISGNMTDQIEVSDTYQSELTEKGTDRSPTNQDISYPEDKQDGHPTKEVLYEIEGRVEDDIKPSAEQTAHQEKEGLFSEVEESESSLQTMQSEINAPLDSQPQQDDISFNPIGNRRKLGSSRRNRGRQHVKDSAAESDHEHKEDVESTRGNEAIETAQILLATEITSQEGSEHDVIPETHDSFLYSATMTDYSSEVQSPTTTNYPEADLESLIPESENFQEDHDDRETHFKVEVSDKSVGATLEGSDKSDSLQSQEVKGQHPSEDAVNKEHEQEVKPTENQEMPQIDKSSESVIRDATENSEIISGNLTDQTEVSDTYQSELTEKSTDGSPTNQDISYPEDKQDEHPTDENNFEALEQKNEDYHVYDTKEPQISDIERVDSALGQVYEIEGRVEDDIKPSAEQTAHQEKEGLFSEVEERESSLLTVQSEINATLDSQPQQDDISFNPIGNRRKLGSSRRNRGRRHVKDSAAESDHEPTEDVVGNTRDNEPLETTEMSLTIETAVQEKSMETMLEGMDTFDTPQTEDVSDQVKENAHFGTVVDIDLHSSSTVDQQTIDQSNFREMPDEELLNVSSVTEKENKERDEDTELFRQVGHLQTNYLVSEDIESSITPEITTEKHSSREHTEPEYSVEQAIFSSPEEELQTNEEQNEIFKLPEVKGEHHSEDAVNKEHEQEVKPTENQEMPQIDNSSESVMCDATENSELISGNLTDQTEVSDIYQSELTEKSTDGSPTNQDISYPEDKQDEHLPKELVYEIEGRVEDDIKPSAEQTAHQEKEGLFSEVEESESSLLTVQSEINAPLDSQPQQDDTSFNPIGNRRKLGSSRRNRGRQHVKDSAAESDHEHKEDVESTRGNEAIETAQMLLATERTSQEELSQGTEHDVIPETHDSSLYSATMTDYSSEVQSPTTTNYPEADLESLIPESENLQEDHDDRETHFKVEVSDKPVGATLEGSDKSDSLQGQEVKGQHHSEDAVNKEHEQEVKPTENQEMPQIDNSSESVIRDEVSDTYQSELTEKSTDGSPTNQDISYPEDKQDEHPTDENNFEALEQKNEDYHVYDTKEPQISDIERVDTAPGQVYEIEGRVEDDIKPGAEQTAHQEKEGLFSEVEESESSLQTMQSEINATLDSRPQQDDTSFNPIGNRRKLGSSRRNRGRQHVKDSAAESDHEHKEDVKSTSGNEAIETAQILLATERTSQEELSQGSEHDVIPETHDSSLYSATVTDYSSEVQSPTTTNYPEADLESLIPESENLQKDHDERETHFKVEVSDKSVGATLEGAVKSDSLQGQEVKGQHPSEDAVNKDHEHEVKPTENQEMPQIHNSSENVMHDATENSEIISGNLTDQTEVSDTYQSELTEKSTDGSPTNQDISYPDDKQDEHPTKEVLYEIEGRVEDDIKPSAEQTAHPEKEGLFSEVEESGSSLLTVQSEINAPLDSQPQQDDTSFNPIGNRRKLGSSRRNRGRQHVKDSAAESDHEPTEDVVGNTRNNEPLEITEMSLTIETAVQEKSMETMLEGMDTFDTPQTEDVSDQVKENAYVGTVVGIDLHSSTTVDQQMIDQSNFRDIPDEELLNVSSVTEKENKERDEDTELFRQVGHLQTNYLVSEDIESSITPEITTEKHSSREHTEPEYSVEQAIFSSPEEELPTNEEQNEIFNLPEQEVKPIENQEMPQIDNSSESVMHDATENSELISGNLTDQTEVSDTYQSELTEKNTDGSPTNQDISCPEDKQDEHPTKEVVYEIEGRVEDDIKPSAEQTVHQEKEGLFSEVEESESSLLTVQSEINASLDSQPQQDDTSFNPIGNRRKLGSSRRNRGRRHVKDSAAESDHEHKEDVESTRGNEAIETAQMLLATERTSQEELSQGSEHDVIPETHDISLYSATVTDYSSEVQSPTTTNYPEADLESLIPESENLQEDHDERETHFKVEVSDKSVGATLEGSDKSDSLQSQEVKGQHHSEDAVNKEHEHEVKPTENQEMPQIDNSSESVIRDEVSDTYQSELTEKSTDGSPTNQDISYPEDKQDEHPTKEVLYEIEGRVEDDIKPSAEQTAHQEKEGLFSEVEESESSLQTVQSEINAPLDSQPQQDDTSFNPIGNRRKLGSSRRNRGRQHVKDSVAESDHEHKEDVESTSGNEAIETAQMLLATERMSQEELSQGSEHDVIPETHDSSLYSATMTDYSSEVQSPTTTNYPEVDLESLIPESENLQEDHDDRETHFKVEVSDKSVGATLEGSDKSDSLQSQEVKGQHHSEDAVNKEHEQEVKPTENQEMPQIDKSQPQQDDISFNPIGNRRKLGSSRRHRGRQHVMDSAAESDHEPTEDVVGNTRDNEPLEITEMSLTIETAVQEKSMETMLEGMDTFDTPQTEDVSDQVKHVGTQERDEDTESVRRDENLQTNYLVSETQAKSEDIESSISPEVSSENSSPGEHTEIECSVEQAAFSSSKEELSTNEERTEHVSLGARPLEDAINKVHEEAIKPIQMQEMPQIDNSSIKDSELTLQTMQSEHFDPQHLDNSQSINEQTHTGFSPKGHRRKLGSSRRQKGRLHVEDTTKMSLPMETMRQEELKEQTDLDFKFAGEIRSTVNNEGNTEKMLEEDTIVATDMTSSSGKDDFVKSNEEVNEEECKLIKETENLSQLRCDTVKMDLIQSLDVSATAVNMQQTNDTPENVGDVTKQDYETEAESSMHVQVYGLDEDGEQFEDTTKKDHEAHEMNVSPEITHAERFSAPHDKTDTLAPFDVGLEENIQAEPAVAVSEESGISSQQGIQEQANLDDGENLQGGSKQKRRKLGSTRRTQLNRKPEEKTVETKDLNADADMRSLDKMEVVEELTMTVTAEGSQNENAKPSQSPEDKEQQETISKAFFPEQSASHNDEVVNPVKFVHVADVRDNERNVEPSQIDDFTATEMHISDLLSANTEDSTGTGITDRGFVSSWGTTQSTRGDEERPESVNITQDQSLKSAEVPVVADFEIVKAAVRGGAAEEHTNAQASKQESDDADEGAHNKHLEMKNASPNLDSTNRKRKMGSSRRNLVSRTKREDLNQKQEVDDEATETETNVGDVKTVSFSGNVEDEPQLHTEHKDSEQREESETVAYSHTDEENPVSHGQLVETEHQLTPSYLPSTPSTSPKHDSMSESSPGGRRRKMGSHRKSHGHQNNENQTAGGDRKTDNERDVRSITDESAIKTTEEPNERPLGLDKISEVDQSDKKPSSNISTAKSEKTPEPGTPVQRPNAEIVLGQESQHKFSLAGDSRGADLRANAFNVMMVGDSSVGKSSFMKRAQSGKFSLEIPASIGLDSCMWTVVVDGKPVVLQLWDTAGQERFHSITRQIFHKAHAFLLMYDITSSQSFSAVSYWANCIQEGASENVTILLAGNKCDHAERQVNTEKAEALAKEYNFEFMECSAATGENVVHCLETVARMLSQKIDTREEDLVLHKEPQQRKSRCC